MCKYFPDIACALLTKKFKVLQGATRTLIPGVFTAGAAEVAVSQKRNTARSRAEDKVAKEPKSQLKSNQAAMSVKCKVGRSGTVTVLRKPSGHSLLGAEAAVSSFTSFAFRRIATA